MAAPGLPPFAALRAFEAVGRLGGVRRAAQDLGIDHTVVSRHLRTLEHWLGLPLIERGGGALRLTAAGSAYHARIASALHELGEATREAMASPPTRPLQVWAVPGFAAQWLADRLTAYETLPGGATVELRPTDRCADLARFEADADIRYYGDDWAPQPGGAGLMVAELARPPLMIVASPALAATLRLSGPADLMMAPLLHEEHHEQWRAWLARNGVSAGPLQGPLLWHAHLALAAARAGRGLALANRFLVAQDLAAGTLVRVAVPGTREVAVGAYAFVARAERWTSAPIAQLRKYLQQSAADQGAVHN